MFFLKRSKRYRSLLAKLKECQSRSFAPLIVVNLITILSLANPVLANPATPATKANALIASDNAKLSALNCAIIHQEIELEKSNARFLMNSHPEGRWKAWRYFLFQETGGSLIEAGLITGIADRYHQIDHGGKIRGVLLEDSFVPQMIGQFVAAAGDVVELGLNVRLSNRAHRENRDIRASKQVACRMHNKLLRLLAERDALLKNKPFLSDSVSQLETCILRDEERLVWLQYSRSLSNARRLAGTENTFYSLDILKNLTGATGNILSIAATSQGRRKLNIGANVLTTISGALIMSDPVSSRIAGKFVAKIHSKGLATNYRREIDKVVVSLTDNSSAMRRAYEHLDDHDGSKNRLLSTRVNLYSKHAERAGRFVEDQKTRDRKANTGALNNIAVAAFAGGTKVAAGTCGIVAASRLTDHAGASVSLGGTAAYTAGTDLTLFDNLKINVIRERRFDLQRKTATTSKDVLMREICDLDVLDKQLTDCECAQSAD